jgi:hypothetical protein
MLNVYKNQQNRRILFYLCPSVRPSKIFFVAFFSVTVDGRNLIFGHKRHIGIPYCGKRFWTIQNVCSMCIKINKVGKQKVGI